MAKLSGTSVSYIINAKDGTQAAVNSATAGTKRVGTATERMAARTKLELANMRKYWLAAKVAIGIAVVAAAAALRNIIISTAETGDQFHKMALRTGVTVEKLSALGYAAQISGTDIKTLEKSLRYASKVMVDYSLGIGEGKRTLDALGLTVVGTNGKMKGTADFLVEVADKFKNMEDATQMAAYASEIFGAKAGTQLLPLLKLGSEGIEALMQKAKELGIVMSAEDAAKAAEFTDAMTDLKGALEGVKRIIGTELLPAVKDYVEKMTEWIRQNKELIAQRVDETITKISDSMATVVRIYNSLPAGVVGAAGVGLVGTMLLGPQAGAVLGTLYLVNAQIEKYGLNATKLRVEAEMAADANALAVKMSGLFGGGSAGEVSGAGRGWEDPGAAAERLRILQQELAARNAAKTRADEEDAERRRQWRIWVAEEEAIADAQTRAMTLDQQASYYEADIAAGVAASKRKLDLIKKTAEQEKRIKAAGYKDMMRNSAYFFQAMGKQSEAAFRVFQAIEIGQTMMSTYAAAQDAYAWGMKYGGPYGPALAVAAAAAAVAAGIARVHQIASMTPDGGTGAVGTYSASSSTGLPESNNNSYDTPGGDVDDEEEQLRPLQITVINYGYMNTDEDGVARDLVPRIRKAIKDGV
ncbi:MAG: hypothetical protein JRC90_04755 [Deltaproteobacteria bacterium]|nr:hypothetical protein [Deltaproteobacteria bacterium]